VVVRFLAGQSQRGGRVQSLDAGIWFPVPFHISIASILINCVSFLRFYQCAICVPLC
jgi:hypothetical protein